MPELPEVETTRRTIAPHVVGRRIEGVAVYDPRLRWPVPASLPRQLQGQSIAAVDRRSKYLLFRLGLQTLVFHFGMTGSLRVLRTPSPPAAHDHVDVALDDGAILRYHDPRRFGAMLLLPEPVAEHWLLAALGPEPFDRSFDGAYLWRALRSRTAAIKLALMDNRVVVGVGNIYASEALFRAGIRPAVSARRVSRARIGRLVDAVREVLAAAIDSGGSTLRDYVDGGGRPGEAQLRHFVYGREGLPCRICSAPIRMRRLGARASFYCPVCQT